MRPPTRAEVLEVAERDSALYLMLAAQYGHLYADGDECYRRTAASEWVGLPALRRDEAITHGTLLGLVGVDAHVRLLARVAAMRAVEEAFAMGDAG